MLSVRNIDKAYKYTFKKFKRATNKFFKEKLTLKQSKSMLYYPIQYINCFYFEHYLNWHKKFRNVAYMLRMRVTKLGAHRYFRHLIPILPNCKLCHNPSESIPHFFTCTKHTNKRLHTYSHSQSIEYTRRALRLNIFYYKHPNRTKTLSHQDRKLWLTLYRRCSHYYKTFIQNPT